MLVRVKIKGDGTDKNPLSANLPTWKLVHGNLSQGWIIVDVPDDVHGLADSDLNDSAFDITTHGNVYTLSELALAKLHDNLDAKYVEHKGKFRVEPV